MRTNSLAFFLAVLLTIVLAGKDYYQILEIPRNSDKQQIKKAFKRLAFQHHPGKYRLDLTLFEQQSQIYEAYRVLSHSKSKRIYDQQGLDKQQESYFSQAIHFFKEIYLFIFEGAKQSQEGLNDQLQEQKGDLFSESYVKVLDENNIYQLFRRQEVWVILFYQSNQSESINIQESYQQLASKFYGIFKVAAIDCRGQEESICEDEFEVEEFPSIQIFESNIYSQRHQYNGNIHDNESISHFAISFLENYVHSVKDSSYSEFLLENKDKNIILLFTTEQKSSTTSSLFQVFSKEFNERLTFGEIKESEQLLTSQFQISSFPTLLVLTDPLNMQGTKYEGTFNKDQIHKFLREYSQVNSSISRVLSLFKFSKKSPFQMVK